MQFDARAAKLLKAGDHLTVAGAPGLRLVRSTVGWAWVYRFKSPADGRMRQVKLGEWPAMSAAAAGVEWERLRAARGQGHDPAQERRQARRRAGNVVVVLVDVPLHAVLHLVWRVHPVPRLVASVTNHGSQAWAVPVPLGGFAHQFQHQHVLHSFSAKIACARVRPRLHRLSQRQRASQSPVLAGSGIV